MKIIALRGLPASGKTTIRRALLAELPEPVGYTSRDELRETYPNETEKQITVRHDKELRALLDNGVSVIVDNTNLSPKSITRLQQIAQEYRAYFEIVDVDTHWMDCIIRDMERRERGERYVGRSVIIQMAMRYGLYKDRMRPGAIICDLDGTLADVSWKRHHIAGPGKKDWHSFMSAIPEDPVNEAVATVVKLVAASSDLTVLYLSGRNEQYRRITEEWLEKHGLDVHHALFMRPRDSHGDDTDVKRDLYRRFVEPYFDVKFALDDRDRIVNLWRNEIGIPCFQVAPGDF